MLKNIDMDLGALGLCGRNSSCFASNPIDHDLFGNIDECRSRCFFATLSVTVKKIKFNTITCTELSNVFFQFVIVEMPLFRSFVVFIPVGKKLFAFVTSTESVVFWYDQI